MRQRSSQLWRGERGLDHSKMERTWKIERVLREKKRCGGGGKRKMRKKEEGEEEEEGDTGGMLSKCTKQTNKKLRRGGGELWKLRKSGWKGHKIRALPFIGFMRIEEQKSQVLVENKKKSGLHLGVHLGPEKKQFFVIQKGFLRPKNIRILDLR